MDRISAHELALEIIDGCLSYGEWPNRALDALIERALDESDAFSSAAATRALFSVVIERLADLFEPALCDVYMRLFSRVIARALPDYDANDLQLRYNRVRRIQPFLGGEVNRVFVLSRVTLGADVAITSVVLSAVKRRFPDAEICLVGPEKNTELFGADERIRPISSVYGRSFTLRDRLLAATELRSIVDETASVVVDPDSRLTQLGLIPICDDARYYFFESRSFGGASDLGLPLLTSLWMQDVFGVEGSEPYVAPSGEPAASDCCVSWGVGENEDKRVDDSFEEAVLAELLSLGLTVQLDRGAGGAEAERADSLAKKLNSGRLLIHHGSYASFAANIVRSRLYVGYDSAGQHVAAAANVPLVSVFSGFASDRMYWRWKPSGKSVITLRNTPPLNSKELTANTLAALRHLARGFAKLPDTLNG